MGVPVMIIGESGTGKTTSLRNFKNGEIAVVNVSKKMLPFKAEFATLETDNYQQITTAIRQSKCPSLAIDDSTYLMVNAYMRSAKTVGYQKYTDMALDFWSLVQFVINELPKNKIVYFLGHLERDANGNEKFKTVGKMLDSTVTLEGLFTVVLKTVMQDGRYMFATQNSGADTVKSPLGMFDKNLIDNDLKEVDKKIRAFWAM